MKITDYLAIYAAVLSTAVAIWNYVRARPKINIELVHAIDGFVISVQNPSFYTVHITNVSLVYPYKNEKVIHYFKHIARFKRFPRTFGWTHSDLSLHGIKSGCPISIESGKAHLIQVPSTVLNEIRVQAISSNIRAVAQDALWRNKYSKVFNYNC